MTTKKNDKRNSVCVGCGKRLSVMTASGEIKWQPSHVDDEGLYCADCYDKHAAKHKKNRKGK